MALKFGTSGVRGLVTEMTDRECCLYALAFIRYLKDKTMPRAVALAGDLRKSTPRILRAAAFAVHEEGLEVDFCGMIPTPGITFHGLQENRPGIMVTGSHVPADRNGMKLNMPWGEVLKSDEQEISDRYRELRHQEEEKTRQGLSSFTEEGELKESFVFDVEKANIHPRQNYMASYLRFFPSECLRGLKVVFYQHSSVARDIIPELLGTLGADIIKVGWSDEFVPVDTEAVQDTARLAGWVKDLEADALVSTDGDGDRPLIVDEKGKVMRGDILGILVSDSLGADSVSAPVSCNTALEKCDRFGNVLRTRIGSPYVIESMLSAVRSGHETVVGYEANGGFLTATDIVSPHTGASLKALPTRDASLPIISLLQMAREKDESISGLVSALPARFTFSGLLRNFASEKGREIVDTFEVKGRELADKLFEKHLGPAETIDLTDGARITCRSGDIVHLRPSGNAPEFRCYTESSSETRASEINELALGVISETYS